MTNHFPHKTTQSNTQPAFKKQGYATQPITLDANANEFAKYIKKVYSYKNLIYAKFSLMARK